MSPVCYWGFDPDFNYGRETQVGTAPGYNWFCKRAQTKKDLISKKSRLSKAYCVGKQRQAHERAKTLPWPTIFLCSSACLPCLILIILGTASTLIVVVPAASLVATPVLTIRAT